MKRFLVSFLIVISALLVLVSFAETKAEQTLDIEGIPKNRLVCEETYYEIYAVLNGKRVKCEWTVSDADAARISSAKKLYVRNVKKEISFTLTAFHEGTGLSATVSLTAVPAAKEIALRKADGSRISGDISVMLSNEPVLLTLTASVSPADAGSILFWKSSDSSVAEVNSSGAVTVKDSGDALITVETVNGKSAKVNVHAYYAPEKIELSVPEELAVKEKAILKYTVYPEKASDVRVELKSSNTKILTVNQKGEISALRAGKAEIIATAENGVQVRKQIEVYTPVSSVSFTNYLEIAVGETKAFTVKVKPENAKHTQLTFTSDSPEIAVVDQMGNVTGVAPGKARIRVTTENGCKSARDVTVKYVPAKLLEQEAYYKSMLPGDEYVFAVALNPKNASDRVISYESSDSSVAVVDENGKITAVAPGRAEITAKSENTAVAPVSISIRVKSGADAKPLEGIIVGINPGHQITRDFTQLPVAPGSRQTKNANSGYAIGTKTGNTEYQVNLDISLLLRDELEALGATVVMTRTTNDVKINNIERARMLNEAGCDVALQIHCNNSSKKELTGFKEYVKTKDMESRIIAWKIVDGVYVEAGAKKNNLHYSDGYMSLNWSTTPSILVECGYMSNPAEDVRLGTPEYQLALAKGIAKGLTYYFG